MNQRIEELEAIVADAKRVEKAPNAVVTRRTTRPCLRNNKAIRFQLSSIMKDVINGELSDKQANVLVKCCHEAFLINSFELDKRLPDVMKQIAELEAEHERLREAASKQRKLAAPDVKQTEPASVRTAAPEDKT